MNHLPLYLVIYKCHTTLTGLVGIARNPAHILFNQLFSVAIVDHQHIIDGGLLRRFWRLYQLAAASWQTGPLKSRISWRRTKIFY